MKKKKPVVSTGFTGDKRWNKGKESKEDSGLNRGWDKYR